MKEINEPIAVAYDGTKFYGENRVKECEKYEDDHLKNIESEMVGNIIVENINILLGNDGVGYVKFLNDTGKELLKKWCINRGVEINKNSIDRVGLHEWYEICPIDNGYAYTINGRSLDDEIFKISMIFNSLNRAEINNANTALINVITKENN